MSMNMSHCRMENTATAVEECTRAMENAGGLKALYQSLPSHERAGLEELLKEIQKFNEQTDWYDDVEDYIEEVLKSEDE